MAAEEERWRTQLRERSLSAVVILELLLIFVGGPMVALEVTGSRLLVLVLSLLVTAAGVIVVSRDRMAAAAITVTTLGSIAVSNLTPVPRSLLMVTLENGGRIIALLVLSYVVGLAVFGPGRVTVHRIRGAVAIYLQIGMIFAFTYNIILARLPGAFSPALPGGLAGSQRLLYFSFVTLTSTGFGDVAPVHPVAQSLVGVEAILGQLFPATILARLVTLEMEARRR